MFSSYPYAYSYTTYSMPLYNYFLPILALIVIIAGGLALYFLFVRKPNHYQGAAAKLHDALTFRNPGEQRCPAVLQLFRRAACVHQRQPDRAHRI